MTIQLRGEPSHHGTRKCYEFYGCRCAPCWAAGVTARAKKREYMRDYSGRVPQAEPRQAP